MCRLTDWLLYFLWLLLLPNGLSVAVCESQVHHIRLYLVSTYFCTFICLTSGQPLSYHITDTRTNVWSKFDHQFGREPFSILFILSSLCYPLLFTPAREWCREIKWSTDIHTLGWEHPKYFWFECKCVLCLFLSLPLLCSVWKADTMMYKMTNGK